MATDDGFLWARGAIEVFIDVNPSVTLSVSYPPGSSGCADPASVSDSTEPPDEVGGITITPPPPDEVEGVEILPFTGVNAAQLGGGALAFLALGLVLLLSARREHEET